HVDHAGGLADFPWARVHVARAEHAALARRVVGYYRAAWRHGVNWVPYDFESDGTRDLLGDGSLVALDAPGHTPGHTMFRLRGASVDVFHLGDAAVTPADYMDGEPRPNLFARAIASDRKTMCATLGRLYQLRRAHPDAVFVSSHDPTAVA